MFAEGVVIADALCWHGATSELLDETGVPVSAVARALLFRLCTSQARVSTGVGTELLDDEARRLEQAASLIGL